MSLPLTSRGNERFTGISLNSAVAILDFFLEIERGLVPLAPLATPMVIESKCMSLSQIYTEGVMPILMISRSRGRHIGIIFFFKIDKEPGPPNISD